ncbi:glycosyltransferase family 2 protein [Dolichospermum circinale]|uniref:glycosyltransferase family 2 protein n=1 Tax=Dolichospermum circinale TaxID=109265 RepID=UPI00040C7F53|nr:glycosyltransferase family 2 protein [Dolichospermum circinale]MDB9474269.1 glycosyltransferase family 2 protein [Dolichospermum circinale CS-537/11]MDB9480782.1 glycosyltransferase family 2 protein [Dolichospermum circinale CS-537/03]MDB9484390.1 glycosyltransferase family 2 protein [Dolichospermum circinale CS-537/05]
MPLVNTALTLKDLPPAPEGKTGWPWTEQSEPLPDRMADGSDWPRISIVTPSYNQGQFIEETIRSVLLQGYPNLEYIIIDGGSNDNSVEIIKKYEQYLTYWISEADRGQSHAINKGWEKCTGDYLAWINSDDCYISNALSCAIKRFIEYKCDFIYGPTYIGSSLGEKQIIEGKGITDFKLKNLLKFFYNVEYIIPSQSVLLSKKLYSQIGFLDEDLHYCMDLDLFAKIILANPLVYRNSQPICFYRTHDMAKTCKQRELMRKESIEIAKKYSHLLAIKDWEKILRLISYSKYLEEYHTNQREKTITNLLNTVFELPLESLTDTRFLGLIKRALFKSFVQ